MLYLLGEEERIVGITGYTVRPVRAKSEKPIVSSFISGNINKIKSLDPDLVIGFSDIQAQLSHDLIKEGLNVLIFNQRSIGEIMETMQCIGNIVGKGEMAANVISGWKEQMGLLREKSVLKKNKPKVFFQEWDEPVITGIQWVSELIEIAGGMDCFEELKEKKMAKDRIVSLDEVGAKNPDIIIGSWCGKKMDFDWVKTRKEWKDTSAIRNNRIFEMDSSIILQPGPALFIDGVQLLEKIINSI